MNLSTLAKKSLAVFTSALSLLSANEAKGQSQDVDGSDGNGSKLESFKSKNLNRKFILKLNSDNPADYLLAQHRSHSSHSSHSSHRSHYSSGRGGGGLPLGLIAVGGAIAYAAYQAGKSKDKNKR